MGFRIFIVKKIWRHGFSWFGLPPLISLRFPPLSVHPQHPCSRANPPTSLLSKVYTDPKATLCTEVQPRSGCYGWISSVQPSNTQDCSGNFNPWSSWVGFNMSNRGSHRSTEDKVYQAIPAAVLETSAIQGWCCWAGRTAEEILCLRIIVVFQPHTLPYLDPPAI